MIGLVKQYGGLPRPVYVLFVSKIVDAAGCFIFPLLTLVLTRKIGLSETQAGYVMAGVAVTTAPALLAGGKLADLIGRKRAMLIATGLGITCYAVCGLIPPSSWTVALMIAGLAGLFAAGPAQDALVADLVQPEQRRKAYSLLYLGWNVGFAAGPAVGGFLLARHLNLMFLGDAATALAALVLVMTLVPEPQRGPKTGVAASESAEKGSILVVLIKRPVLIGLAVVLLGYSVAYAQWGFLLPIHMSRLFSETGERAFGALASINGITVIVFNPVMTLLFRRVPHWLTLLMGGILYAVGFGLYSLAGGIPAFFLLAFVFTLGEVACAISTLPFIMSRTPVSHRGRMASVAQIMSGSGNALGPLLVGVVLASVSIQATWVGIGLVAFAASLLMLAIGRRNA